ncbi:MAG: hypothetical protein US70_C0009G0031 [Parcubacteria group bacterium GW2011_GWD2_38_11]|nr:MAG: hypothetical protein US70_C0009G0031 [Parcubacteria group bacterium GW2011_GWD2_38_11]
MRELFIIMVVVLLVSFSNVVFAVEEEAARITMEELKKRNIEVNFSSKVLSKSVGDAGTVFYNRSVVENELTITHTPSGVYLEIWVSTSLKNAGVSTNYGNEIDYTLGWAGEVAGIGIDAGVSYWDIATLFESPEGDIVQPYLELNKKFDIIEEGHTLTPSIKAEYGIPAKGNDVGSKGLHMHTALKHNWEISKDFSINHQVEMVYDYGAYGADKALIGAYEVCPSYVVADWLSLDASAKVISPLTKVDDGRKTEWIYGGGVTFSF